MRQLFPSTVRQDPLKENPDDTAECILRRERFLSQHLRSNEILYRADVGKEEDSLVDIASYVPFGYTLVKKGGECLRESLPAKNLNAHPQIRVEPTEVFLEGPANSPALLPHECEDGRQFLEEVSVASGDFPKNQPHLSQCPINYLGQQIVLTAEDFVEGLLAHPEFRDELLNG